MGNAQKINQLEKQIKHLEDEVATIQEQCKHKVTHVKFENGTSNMRLYCSECNRQLGFPSQNEIDKFLNVK